MSFSFSAAGHRADVIESLKAVDNYGSKIGDAVRDAIVAALTEDEGKTGGSGYQYVYVVKASGHSGGPGTAMAMLNATVETIYQATPD